VRLGEKTVVPRLADIYAALPAITGKIELEYEGEIIGAAPIARELIRRAADATLRERSLGDALALDEVVMWFDTGQALQVSDESSTAVARKGFAAVPGLLDQVIASGLANGDDADAVVGCELILEALVARRKISRSEGGQYSRSARRKQGMPPERPEREE
jgi:magnesium chelatase subunit I